MGNFVCSSSKFPNSKDTMVKTWRAGLAVDATAQKKGGGEIR